MLTKLRSLLRQRREGIRALRVRGDQARDRRNWIEAAGYYERYLTRQPDDFSIWVQFGHMLKESGNLVAADDAYARAITLQPSDADLLLHYGRLKKLIGEAKSARDLLVRSLAAGYSQHAFNELRSVAIENFGSVHVNDEQVGDLGRLMAGVVPTMMTDIDFDCEQQTLTLKGGDPWMLLAINQPPVNRSPAAILRFAISGVDPDRELARPRVYLDFGNGMSEETVCIPENTGQGYAVLLVRPEALKQLRWDPDDHEGIFRIQRIEYVSIDDEHTFEKALIETSGPFYRCPAAKEFSDPILSKRRLTSNAIEKLQQASPSNQRKSFNYRLWTNLYDNPSTGEKQQMASILASMAETPTISVILPVFNPPAAFLIKCIESVLGQNYPHFELCIADDHSTDPEIFRIINHFERADSRVKVAFREKNGHIAAASNSALELATGEFIALLDHDDVLAEHALFTMARFMDANPHVQILFSDEDKIDIDGNRSDPYFKSGYNQFFMYGQNMVTHLGVYRRSLVDEIGGFRESFDGSQDYDLMLRCAERVRRDQIVHVPHVLYHWRMIPGSTAIGADQKNYAIVAARGALNGHFERKGLPFRSVPGIHPGVSAVVQTKRFSTPISIIIPTRDGIELLEPCLRSILHHGVADVEIIIVDNGSVERRTKLFLESITKHQNVRVLDYQQPFNYSKINNFAAAHSSGELLCFLNNDTEVLAGDWLSRARLWLSQPDVGAVGARLYYPDMTIQHFGTVVGLGRDRVGGHIGLGTPRNDLGQFNRSGLLAEFTAVTAACLFMRRTVFMEVSGFDEELVVAFNDVDLCMKVRAAGYLVIADPQIELIHKESKSRGSDQTGEKRKRFLREVRLMHSKWGSSLIEDPYYSPNLSVDLLDFSYAFPPRVPRPWDEQIL